MDDIIESFILKTSLTNILENVIVAPCWTPSSVGIEDSELLIDSSIKVWTCSMAGNRFTYILTGVGAFACHDIVMALSKTRCEKVLFIGSAGALNEDISIGDIAIPSCVICAEGATRFHNKNMFLDVFGEKYYPDTLLQKKVCNSLFPIASKCGILCHSGIGISVESIYSQYDHIDEFIQLNCSFIDMESSAFLSAAVHLGLATSVVYVISDNAVLGKPLYCVSHKETDFRKKIRKRIIPTVIDTFCRG